MSSHSYGWNGGGPPDQRDWLYAASPLVQASLPSLVDLTVPPRGSLFDGQWDQGNLGSCGPQTAAANLVYDQYKLSGYSLMPSRLFIYYATRRLMGTTSYDSGVDNRSLMKALAQFGWCDEVMWPYDVDKFRIQPIQSCWDVAMKRKIGSYLSVPQSLTSMKSCLAEGFPFIFGFTVYQSFESVETTQTGDVPMPSMSESVLGGHDVLIVGYQDDTQRFKIKNWWNGWGREGGYGTIPYSYALSPKLSADFWTVREPGWTPTPTVTRIVVPVAGTYQLVSV